MERDLWLAESVERGATYAEMAAEAGVGISTIKRWLRDRGLRTHGARARITVEQLDGDDVLRNCPRHGVTVYRPRPSGGFRCLRCRSEAVAKRRRTVKEQLVAEAGGCCALCGYDRYLGALAFHHQDREEKRFSIAQAGVARSIERARHEAAKCVLLCHNCHAEVEAGITAIGRGSIRGVVPA